jgi:hypothetical protein
MPPQSSPDDGIVSRPEMKLGQHEVGRIQLAVAVPENDSGARSSCGARAR